MEPTNFRHGDQITLVIRKNYGNDILLEANYTALGHRYFLKKYLRVDKL